MKRAALGFRMHSGWGVMVAIAGDAAGIELLERRRILITDPEIPGATQPYHFAASLGPGNEHRPQLALPAAKQHIASCTDLSERLAFAAISDVIRELGARDYRIAGAAVLLASGRALPSLDRILAAHPLIHTAEGEFFRTAVRKACERLKIPTTTIPERELEACAKTMFRSAASRVRSRIASLGASIGPPWTKDHRAAALAAAIVQASIIQTSTEENRGGQNAE
jgi:hypothetical protein